jgi:hypothetical protein
MNSATSAVRSQPVRSKTNKCAPYDLLSPMTLDASTDLLSTISHEQGECPRCDTALRMKNGLCLLCLLQTGLTEDEDSGSESLEALFSEFK